jgi:hypothetical protein
MPRHLAHGQLFATLGLAVTAATAPGHALAAFEFNGTKSIVAVTADGGRISIGTVQFTPAEGGASTFKVALKTEIFTDYFLSMREFKCLPSAKEVSCHVPYPYQNPSMAGPGNLAWLEHSLLFLYKTPAEFGAKLWNGVYYEFREQGSSLVGVPKAVDLNEISAPPSNSSIPPLRKALRHDMPADARWIRELVIE